MSMNYPPAFPPNFPMPAPVQGLPPAAPQFPPAAPQFPMGSQPGFQMPFQPQPGLMPSTPEMANFGAPGVPPMMSQPQPAPGMMSGFNPTMPPQTMLGQQPQPMPGMPFPGPQTGMMPPMGNGMTLNLLA